MAFRILLLALLLVYTMGCRTGGGKAAEIDRLMQAYAHEDLFNGSVLVAEHGTPIFRKGYGPANVEWDEPNAPDTRFRLASMSKQFTAMLIMQLCEEGKLSEDGTISDYLPWYRKDIGQRITLHQLMNHSSGLPNYTEFKGFYGEESRKTWKTREFVEKFCSGDLQFEPGSKYEYCNSGFYILGAIVEEVTGKSWPDVLQERILTPAGMTQSGVDEYVNIIPHRAQGYRRAGEKWQNTSYQDMSIYRSAGSMYSSVEDLFKWSRALHENSLVGEEWKEKMWTPYLGGYGYGFGISKDPSSTADHPVRRISHSGYYDGFNTYICIYPEQDHTIVLLNNTGKTVLPDIRDNIGDILFGREYSLPVATHQIASPNKAVKIGRISSQGEIRDDDAMFDNGEDPAGRTIYFQGFAIHDGENAYVAGTTTKGAEIVDGAVHESATVITNRGMTYSETPWLSSDLEMQIVDRAAGAVLTMKWTFRNSSAEARNVRLVWFDDVDNYVDDSDTSTDRAMARDGELVMLNGGDVKMLRQALVMSMTPHTAYFGVNTDSGASQYWRSAGDFEKTGISAAEYRIAPSLANTIQGDANKDGIADKTGDVAGAFETEIELPASGSKSVTCEIKWNAAE